MSTLNTIAATTTQVADVFIIPPDNSLRVHSPNGKIPDTPYYEFLSSTMEAPSQKVGASSVSPSQVNTPTGVQFVNPS